MLYHCEYILFEQKGLHMHYIETLHGYYVVAYIICIL